MSRVRIVLAATEEGAYIEQTVRALRGACTEAALDPEIVVTTPAGAYEAARSALAGVEEIALRSIETRSLARLYNVGAGTTEGDRILFLREGILLHGEGLRLMCDALARDVEVGAVGAFSNRTTYGWQYLNAAHIEAHGSTPEAYLRDHGVEVAEGVALENFALLMRREVFAAAGGFFEEFPAAGGEDIDLSFRLKSAGYRLLRVPAYFPHAGADVCELYDLTRTLARPILLERWSLDIGIPEKLWWDALAAIDFSLGESLVHATCRSALLSAPLVSIMIPTYNRPGYFRETLESARAQTYPNIEIIIADSSTNDATETLMAAYRNDRRIRYLRTKIDRLEKIRMQGMMAQGEFFQWCMDDDILLPDKLTLMVDAFLRYPGVTLATSRRGVIDGEGNFQGQWTDFPVHGNMEVISGRAIGRTLLMTHTNFIGESSAVLYRRGDTAVPFWEIPVRKGYAHNSDCAMWLQLLERGDCAFYVRPMSLFRVYDGQEGGRKEGVMRGVIEWWRLLDEHCQQHIFLTEADYPEIAQRLRTSFGAFAEAMLPQMPQEMQREYRMRSTRAASCGEAEKEEASLPVVLFNRIDSCAHVRLDTPLRAMQAAGVVALHGCTEETDDRLPIITLGKEENSIILIQRQVYPNTSGQTELFALSTARGNVLLHEMDDHPCVVSALSETNYFSFRAVSAVQTSTPPLADILREFNPHVLLLENQLADLPPQRRYARGAARVTVFFGALNRGADWAPLMDALHEVIRAHGARLSFLVTGDRAFYDALQTPHKEFVWGKDGDPVASYADYTAALHRSDIALLPLGDTVFNRTKSDLKFIEAAGHGAAVLASPTVYERTLRDGETGLIYRDERAFAEKLTLLVTNDDLRIRLAENAYRYVARHRLIAHHVEEYATAYRDLFARREELEHDRRARMARYFPELMS